ncbi:hypothetical protein EYE40_02595 [Glaciihabitans arcticus]|uniref:Integral membrane protein n=1 Tax=Glaciihabitans arcticus TaxID=2668039 RepID=A0A4Q9GQT3_9MICO|nr:hypothetical protein [Glaciihabitans arcticus]TBN56374.1 hypothetical protein EYE40_02595 [Glaciihabitans arcticus]
MIEWFSWVQAGIAILVGVLAVILGLAGKKPNDYTMGGTALVGVLLVAQLVVALLAPAFGNNATGSVLEYYTYLVSAILIPPAAISYGLVDRTRWSTVVLGVACLAVAVMVLRMQQIWAVQVA